MPTIAEVREKYPQYSDLSDADLASALHRKFYSDMPREQFEAKIGFGSSNVAAQTDEQQGPQAPHPSVRPLASLGGNYDKARHSSQDLMASGLEDLRTPTGGDLLGSAGATLKGVGKLAAGGLGFLASPFTAAQESFGGTPGEDVLGIPKEISMPVLGLATPIPSRIPMPRMARAAEKAETPTAKQLIESYETARTSPEVAAVKIRPEAAGRNAEITRAELESEKHWLTQKRAPETHDILDQLQPPPAPPSKFEMRGLESAGYTSPKAPNVALTMEGADSARQRLNDIIAGGGQDAKAAMLAKQKLDDWMGNMTQADALAGDVPLAQSMMQAGRGDYAAGKLSQALDKKLAEADLRAAGTYSGLNQQNAIKQNVTAFLKSDDSRGLNATQRAAAEAVVRGTAPEKVVRFVANLMGGGGGVGALAGGAVGHSLAGPAGVLAPFAGFGLNRLGASMTGRNADKLSELIRSQSPLAKRMAGPIEDYSKAAEAATVSPTARNLSRLTIASRNLSNNLKDADIHIAPNDLLKSLFGQQKAAADDDE